MEYADIAVTGAGPAGLFCAIHAAGLGVKVVLLEKNKEPGVKLKISGSGQCNLTHEGDIRTFFSRYGSHGTFLKPALMSFKNTDLIRFFNERSLAMETTDNGKIFPVSHRASDICNVLMAECRNRGVTVLCGEPVNTVENTQTGFILHSPRHSIHVQSLVISTGGASYPKTGSTGDGYRIAASLGHTITDIAPALTPLIIAHFPFGDLAGISFSPLAFSVRRNGKKVADRCGDVLFTHTGLSGPGILDCSRDILPGDTLYLSFAGPGTREENDRKFLDLIQHNPKKTIKSGLTSVNIPERLARTLLDLAGIPADLTGAHLTAAQRTKLTGLMTEFPLEVAAPGDFSCAMVTKGGVQLDEVNPKTMESRRVPGLYFAGEVLDIDGDTGGFNLQAAFSTGFLVARSIRVKMSESQKNDPEPDKFR